MKPIRFSTHAKEQLLFRGASEEEVVLTIQNSPKEKAELGRLCARMNFPFEKQWNKRYYKIKQVRPVFAEEESEIVVITVYVYYFDEEDER